MADENNPDGDISPKRQLPLWKKALFSVVVVLLFFGLLEGVLAIFGVKPLLFEDDPYVGFASKIPLFVKQDDQMVTAQNKVKWFNPQGFPRKKLKGTQRVFCMGGSTTFGRPFRDATSFCGWLREYLPAADPAQRWELVNAGGISYASYRIAALMEELADYDPDLFIIYCGHNEFLEDRTYGELMDMPAAVRGLQASLSKSRTYSLISRVVKGKAAGEASELTTEVNTILDNSIGPEAYTRDAENQQKVIAHFRFNLARMVDIARAAGAEVMFVMPASNLRNSSPFKSENGAGLDSAKLGAWNGAFVSARDQHAAGDHAAALASIETALTNDPEHAGSHYLHGRILEAMGRHVPAKAAYELALGTDICPLRMLPEMRGILNEVADDRDVPVVDFNTLMGDSAANGIPGEAEFLDHVHPTIEAHRALALALVDALAKQGIADLVEGWGDAAITSVTAKVMAGVDDYERGIAMRNLANVLKWAGKMEDAYTAAKKSLELTPGDAYANFVTGDLAETLGKADEAMERYKFITGFKLNTEEAPYYVEVHYKYAGLLLDKGDFTECVRMLNRTLELKPGHEGASAALPMALQTWGTRSLRAGKGAEAAAPLEQLAKLKPGDPNVENWLGIALIQAERPMEAIPHLEAALSSNATNPAIHNNIASAYAQLGERQKAATHFQETVRLDPRHLGALTNLGELHLESNQIDKAEEYFKRALQLQPGNPTATARLAQIKQRRTGTPER